MRGPCPRAQPRRRAARAAGRRPCAGEGWTPPLRRGRARPHQPHRLDLARRLRPRLSRRHIRRIARRLSRGDAGPCGRRRRPSAHRDHLRHAERESRLCRRARRLRAKRDRIARDALGHDHRSFGTHPVGPDAGSFLELARPCGPGGGGPQLRARRARDARPCGGAVAHRRHARVRLSQRRPAERIRPLRRKPGIHGRPARRIRARGPRQHRRRLLRHHAGPCARLRAGGAGPRAPQDTRHRPAPAPVRPRALHAHRRHSFRECGRAHQCHRLRPLPQAHQERRIRRRARCRARSGRQRRPDHRREHGRRPARFQTGHGLLPQPHRLRARHRARAGDGGFLEVRRDRGRPAMHSGQGGRQFDLAEGRRGEIRRTGAHRAQLWRRRRRHGLRRTGPGRHVHAQGGDLRARLSHPRGRGRLPAAGHHLRSEYFRGRHRHRGA